MPASNCISGTADPVHPFGANSPLLPFHSLPFPFLLCLFLSSIYTFCQEVTAKSSKEVLGVLWDSPVRSEVEPRPQEHFRIFWGKEICRLATILVRLCNKPNVYMKSLNQNGHQFGLHHVRGHTDTVSCVRKGLWQNVRVLWVAVIPCYMPH